MASNLLACPLAWLSLVRPAQQTWWAVGQVPVPARPPGGSSTLQQARVSSCCCRAVGANEG